MMNMEPIFPAVPFLDGLGPKPVLCCFAGKSNDGGALQRPLPSCATFCDDLVHVAAVLVNNMTGSTAFRLNGYVVDV